MPEKIQTTVVGSYPVPDWLTALPSEQGVADATAVIFHTQELAGIDLVVDGELYRWDINHPETNGMIDYFIRPLTNIRTDIGRGEISALKAEKKMAFRARPAGIVEGPLDEGSLDLVRDYDRARSLTNAPLKFTVTSPYMLARTLVDNHYGDLCELTNALADILADQVAAIDADVLQVDEANITGNPEDAEWAAAALNRVLDRVQNTAAVHLCWGNYGGQSVQKGHWKKLISFLNALHIDHVVGEMAFRGYDELEHFKDMRPEIGVGLGVIDVKTTVIESPEDVANAIEIAAGVLGAERIRYVHPDCGFWMLKRSVADAKMRALVKGRDLFVGA